MTIDKARLAYQMAKQNLLNSTADLLERIALKLRQLATPSAHQQALEGMPGWKLNVKGLNPKLTNVQLSRKLADGTVQLNSVDVVHDEPASADHAIAYAMPALKRWVETLN